MSYDDLSTVVSEVTASLVKSFPSSDRSEADSLLRDSLLPWALRNYRDHPRPESLVGLVADDLRSTFEAAPPAGRIALLRSETDMARARAVDGEALRLALLRYGLENPGSAETVRTRLAATGTVGDLNEVDGRIVAAVAELDDLEAGSGPLDDRTPFQSILARARRTLDAARTGSFDLVDPPLAAELRMLGADPSELHPH